MIMFAGSASYAQTAGAEGLVSAPHTVYVKSTEAAASAFYPPVHLVSSDTSVTRSAGAPYTVHTVSRVTDPVTGLVTETIALTIDEGSLPPGVTIVRSAVFIGTLAFSDVPTEEEIFHIEELSPGSTYTAYTITYDPNKYFSRTYGFDVEYSNGENEASGIYEYYER